MVEFGYAVVCVRTTGLSVEHDRITQIAIVTADACGRAGDTWVAGPGPLPLAELSARLRGRVFAGHQAALARRFVAAAFAGGPVEMPPAPVLCTCDAGRIHLPELPRHRLRDCCAATGVEFRESAGPLGEARAAAGLLGAFNTFAAGNVAERPGPPSSPGGVLAGLLDDLPLADTLSAKAPAVAGTYLELVAETAERGTPGEALAAHGRALGLSRDEIATLHRGFVLAAARAAVAGGRATETVGRELVTLAEVLGVPPGGVQVLLAEAGGELISAFGSGRRPLPPDWAYGEPLRAGQSVAFTGGEPYRRSRLELAAQLAGLRVVNSVTGRTAVLVSGHPRPRSAKGVAAQRSGTRIVTPKVFENLAAHVQPAGPGGRVAGAATIRAWAHANGHIVGPRGRLPRHVQDAFRAVRGHQ